MTGGQGNRFRDDVHLLRQYTPLVLLRDSVGQSQVAVAPALAGRVMTSTCGGGEGTSFGWINRSYFEQFALGRVNPHISPFGGEDRFWIGPEGGQFPIFFKPGDPFDLDHWFTPKSIDVEPFEVEMSSSRQVMLRRRIMLTNYSNTPFDVGIRRIVRLISADDAWKMLNLATISSIQLVAFESDNSITNHGPANWDAHTGLLSIWILGMFNASPQTTVVIPIQSRLESSLGKPVNDDYFGKVPPQRLRVIGDVVYFKGDASFRSKIGISPARARPVVGSYDPSRNLLTICQFSFDPHANKYVNSAWKIQDDPYAGDVVNSYNDGPPAPGMPQLGPFYELETSSATRELQVGEAIQHLHRTIHLQGEDGALDRISRAVFGVALDQIHAALPQ